MTLARRGWMLSLLCGLVLAPWQAVFAEDATVAASLDPPGLRTHLLLTGEQLEAMLGDEDLLLLHVGHGPKGYATRGHVPGAVLIDVLTLLHGFEGAADAEARRDAVLGWLRRHGVDGRRRVVLYDEATGLLAARVYAELAKFGLADRTAMLDGHWRRWVADGRPVDKGGVEVQATDWAPRRDDSLAVLFGQVHTGLRVPGWTLVDARQPRYFRGEQKGWSELQEAGHIPGAVNVHWRGMLASIQDPVLKPVDELRTMYAGVDPDKRVVAYCATGTQSSYTFFVLRYLGYDAVWYDGSLVDWQARGGETARVE
ncbi:MAG: rhodanese-like domain-containing protein [Planctomycetota bacterium]